MWGLIGGSGFEKFDAFEKIESLSVLTPFGKASSGFKKVRVQGHELLFIPRHGENHELLPSEINYRANVFALKKFGAKKILSVSAVGSLRKEYAPGDMVVPTQYIDRTKSLRQTTFCGEGIVGHVSLAQPVSRVFVEEIKKIKTGLVLPFPVHTDKTYVCIEGPQFSTQAESLWYRSMGADIIGMTNFPEYALAREAGLAYLPSCFVTDYDCWDPSIPAVTIEGVLQVMRDNNGKALELLKQILSHPFPEDGASVMGGLKTGLFCNIEKLHPAQKEWLKVLLA